VAITFAEQTPTLYRVIGHAKGSRGTIHFTPADGPGGRRKIVALITNGGAPIQTTTIGSFIAPPPATPAKARKLKLHAGARTFTFTFVAPGNSAHTLIRLSTTDGRHLQELVGPSIHRGSIPVIGFADAATITVTGVGSDGRRGPAVSASARQSAGKPRRKSGPKHRRKGRH
jgi:hypothetical protein